MSSIRLCTCTSKYQDEMHGAFKRVHNAMVLPKGLRMIGWRCTVCGTETKL